MTTITIDRELLEQALVALSAPNHCVFSEPPICVDIRAALAAPATAPTQPAFESWCASMGFIPTQARYETWQAATAAALDRAAKVARSHAGITCAKAILALKDAE